MKKQARVLTLGFFMVMLLGIAVGPAVLVNDAMGEQEEDARIPFVLPTLKADKMPPMYFKHDKHIAVLEDDCSKCHTSSDEFFLESEGMDADKVVAYVHKECVSCHVKMKKGPVLASCRSCHNDAVAEKEQAKAANEKK